MGGWIFQAPGNLNDFQDPQQWHKVMLDNTTEIIADLVGAVLQKSPSDVTKDDIVRVGPMLAYVNPLTGAIPPNAVTGPVNSWRGFPRAVERGAPWTEFPRDNDDPTGRYRAVEHLGDEDHRPGKFVDQDGNVLILPVRDRQDEYLEWAVRQNSDGKITKITFVAEGYDYFYELFNKDEGRVVDIYKEFTGLTNLSADDLRAPKGIYRRNGKRRDSTITEPGKFNPRNKYNISPGIVHLSHRANSLGAEVNLAGVSGIARKNAKEETVDPSDAEKVLCCSEGGDPDRNSDPLIGQQAYSLVLAGRRYTLANPVGLYIAGVDESRLLLPDNKTAVPREWWKEVRGTGIWKPDESRVLRLELEVPKSEKFVVGDLLVDGSPIKYAGRLTDLITVHLFVTSWQRGDKAIGPIVPCTGTCCRQQGHEHLVVSEGPCQNGYDLAFPDLLPAQKLVDLLATVGSEVSTAFTQRTRRRLGRLP
jgi:hypothetical protein